MSLVEFLARRFDMVPLAGVRRMEVEHRAQKAELRRMRCQRWGW